MSACTEKAVEPVFGTPAKSIAPQLYDFPVARSRFELPDSYGAATALFEQAVAAFGDRDYASSAAKFIEGASLLRVAEPTTYSDQFAKIREVAYRNAALAHGAAGTREAGVVALKAAAAADSESEELLTELIAKLSPADG